MSPTVVGIDLSLTSTGIAKIERDGTAYTYRVQSKGRADDTLAQRAERLQHIAGQVSAFVIAARPDLIIIEGPSMAQKAQRGTHDRAGLWWLLVTELHDLGPVVEIPPTSRAKYATGKGNAGKDEVLLAVANRWRDTCTVDGNDTADALVLASMGADHLGDPPVNLPATHRAALDKVAWPTGLIATPSPSA